MAASEYLPGPRTASDHFSRSLEKELASHWADYRTITEPWPTSGFAFTYPALLVETYHYVSRSCPLMAQSRALLGPEHNAVGDYLDRHMSEEQGHELWLLDDLEALGISRRDVLSSTPLLETIALVGCQNFVIDFVHPIGLLGYIYVMETHPPKSEILDVLQTQSGLPKEAFTFLRRHGFSDAAHSVEITHMIDTYCTQDIHYQAVRLAAIAGVAQLNHLLKRIISGDFLSCAASGKRPSLGALLTSSA